MYEDSCTIIEYQECKIPNTGKTDFQEVIVLENQPCRLSFGTSSPTSRDNVAEVEQQTKLFISPEVTIKPGSKLIVTRHLKSGDVVMEYSNSGVPAIYQSHQEVNLKLFDRWS